MMYIFPMDLRFSNDFSQVSGLSPLMLCARDNKSQLVETIANMGGDVNIRSAVCAYGLR